MRPKRLTCSSPTLPLAMAVAAALLTPPALADSVPTAAQLLRRFVTATRNVNMRATELIVSTASSSNVVRTTTRRVVRRNDGRSLSVTMEPASERGMLAMDDGTMRRTYDPQRKILTITHSAPDCSNQADINRRVRLISRNYALHRSGTEVVAGRTCYRLDLHPRHAMSRPVSLWLDAATSAVLRHQETDSNGNTAGFMVVTDVQFPRHISSSELVRRLPAKIRTQNISRSAVHRDVRALRKPLGFRVAMPMSLPGGYEFESGEVMKMDSLPTACLRFTDGIANITVFESRCRMARPDGFRRMEARQQPQGDTMVAYQCGNMDVMVFGRADMNGLIALARGVDGDQERLLTDSIARHYGASSATVDGLRATGVGLDHILALLYIANHAHVPFRMPLGLFRGGWTWPDIARRYRVDVGAIAELIRPLNR